MSAVVECHIVSYLSNDVVLGFDWLCNCSPHIDWWSCALSVKVPSRHYPLASLLLDSIVHVELAFLDSFCKEVDHGAVAWFMLIRPVESPDAMGAYSTLAGGESGDA